MSQCPRCRYRFCVLEDEQSMHECPRCELLPWERRCRECGQWFESRERKQTICRECVRKLGEDQEHILGEQEELP